MTYVAAEARQQLLESIAEAVDQLAVALAALGTAYEALDEHTADRLEEQLFRPAQTAYGRAQRTYTGFAQRHGLRARSFEPAPAPAGGHGVQPLLDRAVGALMHADGSLSALQDSMAPVEVGDPELRAGLSEVRELLTPLPAGAREVSRTLGR